MEKNTWNSDCFIGLDLASVHFFPPVRKKIFGNLAVDLVLHFYLAFCIILVYNLTLEATKQWKKKTNKKNILTCQSLSALHYWGPHCSSTQRARLKKKKKKLNISCRVKCMSLFSLTPQLTNTTSFLNTSPSLKRKATLFTSITVLSIKACVRIKDRIHLIKPQGMSFWKINTRERKKEKELVYVQYSVSRWPETRGHQLHLKASFWFLTSSSF